MTMPLVYKAFHTRVTVFDVSPVYDIILVDVLAATDELLEVVATLRLSQLNAFPQHMHQGLKQIQETLINYYVSHHQENKINII